MVFMKEVLGRSLPLWEACAASPFVRALQAGTLPQEKFKLYMVQDSIYLKHYARIYGKAIYHAATLREIQLYYSILSFVTDTESAVRLRYLERFGLTDDDVEKMEPLPETRRYIDFMQETAEAGDPCGILMAVLPCMLSYSHIFTKVAAEPGTEGSPYLDFILDYAEPRYAESCGQWLAFAEEKCAALPPEKKERLSAVFERASRLELEFWDMAYNGDMKGACAE